MQLAARTGAWTKSGAPIPYLRRVAYLESHGTEWIRIDSVYGQVVNNIICKYEQMEPYPDNVSVFGRSNEAAYYFFGDLAWGDDYYKVVEGLNEIGPFDSFKETNIQFYVFCSANIDLTPGFFITTKLYHLISDKFSLIPVLDFNNKPCLYDEVSGQFFYNQGTGEFTWGEL